MNKQVNESERRGQPSGHGPPKARDGIDVKVHPPRGSESHGDHEKSPGPLGRPSESPTGGHSKVDQRTHAPGGRQVPKEGEIGIGPLTARMFVPG